MSATAKPSTAWAEVKVERVFTARALHLDPVDRIRHVMVIGVAQLETDIKVFEDEALRLHRVAVEQAATAEESEQADRASATMDSLATEFRRYVAEANAIINLIDAMGLIGTRTLAFVSADAAEVRDVVEDLSAFDDGGEG